MTEQNPNGTGVTLTDVMENLVDAIGGLNALDVKRAADLAALTDRVSNLQDRLTDLEQLVSETREAFPERFA